MLTHGQIVAIRERTDRATSGPWEWEFAEDFDGIVISANKFSVVDEEGGVVRYPDAEFVAHARTDIPLPIAEVIRLRAAMAEIAHYEAPFGLDAMGYEVLRIMAQQALNNGGDAE
ncbi:hypothetical protein KM924_23390 [Brevibacillus parabrevis]|uniref:hypothetical protein n=1 Tax=Brevibacillus parabrevis TaxID=54914 RepID=UPI001C21FAD2|nr:hypothetical protein [Brevibacillus parabrevis]MBU8715448.1 hypothetical protein [Brevibacillus parabrevis]